MHAFHLRLNQKERFIGYYPNFSRRLNIFYIAICCLRRLHTHPHSPSIVWTWCDVQRANCRGKKKGGGEGVHGGGEKVVKKERKRHTGFVKFTFSPVRITKILSERWTWIVSLRKSPLVWFTIKSCCFTLHLSVCWSDNRLFPALPSAGPSWSGLQHHKTVEPATCYR